MSTQNPTKSTGSSWALGGCVYGGCKLCQRRGVSEDKKFKMGIKGGKYGKDGEGHERRLVERIIQPVKLWERTRYWMRHPPSRISTRHSTFESLTVTTRATPPPLTFASSSGLCASVIKHCREALVLLDGALHHPVVAESARTRGQRPPPPAPSRPAEDPKGDSFGGGARSNGSRRGPYQKVRRRRARATEHVKGARRIGAIWEAARDSPDPVR